MEFERGLFVVFQRPRGGHSVVYSVRAKSLTEALRLFCADQLMDGEVGEDLAVTINDDGRRRRFSHVIEFLEWIERDGGGEWQIRWVPDERLAQPVCELLCGERERDIEHYKDLVRRHTGWTFPSKRAFVWYLKEGPLVTVIERRGTPLRIRGRFLVDGWRSVREWDGRFEDILNGLSLGAYADPRDSGT